MNEETIQEVLLSLLSRLSVLESNVKLIQHQLETLAKSTSHD